MIIQVHQLGLAAYVKMNGATLLQVQGKTFIFESTLTLSEWRVRYSNSCCCRHDTTLCELRQHLSPS